MSIDDKIQLLRDAIINHKQVTGLCNQYPREFCPHLLGRTGIKWSVLVWQFGGLSDSDLPPEGAWRCFELHDLDQLASREGQWHRGFYSGRRDQHCVKIIHTAVDAEHAAEVRESFGGFIRSRGLRPPHRKRR